MLKEANSNKKAETPVKDKAEATENGEKKRKDF